MLLQACRRAVWPSKLKFDFKPLHVGYGVMIWIDALKLIVEDSVRSDFSLRYRKNKNQLLIAKWPETVSFQRFLSTL